METSLFLQWQATQMTLAFPKKYFSVDSDTDELY